MKTKRPNRPNFFLARMLLAFFLAPLAGKAQSYVGHAFDNYAGVHGVLYNPASVVGTPMRTDINLFSVSGFVGSDYFAVSLNDMLGAEDGFDFDEVADRFPSDRNNFFANADLLGPSFMFNMGERHSIAITTRARGFLNLNSISGNLYENISDGFDETQDFDFDMQDLSANLHVFGEIGLTYGRVLLEKQTGFLKAGATFKYLFGAGGLFTNAPQLAGTYSVENNTLTTNGSLDYGTTQDFESDDITFDNLQGGFGLNLGMVYEYRPRIMNGAVLGRRQQLYKLKLGIAVTHIGAINYSQSEISTYDLNGSVPVSEFDQKDIEDVLNDNYNGTESTVATKLKLPTTMHLTADYHIKGLLYTGLHGAVSMIKSGTPRANGTINTLTLAPRMETKAFSLYTPLTLRQYGSFLWGLGFRLGPLTIGSGSVLTNLISKNSKAADFYFGLKIPLYKKIDFENRS